MEKKSLLLAALVSCVVIGGSMVAMRTTSPCDSSIKELALRVPNQGVRAPNPSETDLFEGECDLRKSISFDKEGLQRLFEQLREEQGELGHDTLSCKKVGRHAQDDSSIFFGANERLVFTQEYKKNNTKMRVMNPVGKVRRYSPGKDFLHCTGMRMFEKRNK